MFVDQVKIFVKGGDGGNGCVSFRREAHVPRGGPDGGLGGKGGDVVLVAVSHQNTLLPLRYQPEHRADRGGHGGPGNRTGRDGSDRDVAVPPGTSARDDGSGEWVGEVLRDGDRLVVARGGRGGRGNRSFLSNRNRAPRESEPGQPGEERWLRLDLRLIEVTREQMAGDLARLAPDEWLREAVHSETGLVTLRQLLLHSIRHLESHVDAIHEKRAALGLDRG